MDTTKVTCTLCMSSSALARVNLRPGEPLGHTLSHIMVTPPQLQPSTAACALAAAKAQHPAEHRLCYSPTACQGQVAPQAQHQTACWGSHHAQPCTQQHTAKQAAAREEVSIGSKVSKAAPVNMIICSTCPKSGMPCWLTIVCTQACPGDLQTQVDQVHSAMPGTAGTSCTCPCRRSRVSCRHAAPAPSPVLCHNACCSVSKDDLFVVVSEVPLHLACGVVEHLQAGGVGALPHRHLQQGRGRAAHSTSSHQPVAWGSTQSSTYHTPAPMSLEEAHVLDVGSHHPKHSHMSGTRQDWKI